MREEVANVREEQIRFADSVYEGAERELVGLAIAIARRVVNQELATRPELLVAWAREAIAGSGFGKRVKIALSPDVAARLAPSSWGDLESALAMDPALPSGTIEVRDEGRTITQSGDERVDLVAAKVKGATDRTAA